MTFSLQYIETFPFLLWLRGNEMMSWKFKTPARENIASHGKQAIFTKCFSHFYERLVQSFPRCCYNHFIIPKARIYSKSIRKYSRTSMCDHLSPISDHIFKTPEFSFGAFCKQPPLVSKRPRPSYKRFKVFHCFHPLVSNQLRHMFISMFVVCISQHEATNIVA